MGNLPSQLKLLIVVKSPNQKLSLHSRRREVLVMGIDIDEFIIKLITSKLFSIDTLGHVSDTDTLITSIF